jgi:hypothetical protein
MSGPTTGAIETENSWTQHRVLARAVRFVVVAVPALAAWLTTGLVAPWLYRPAGAIGTAAWFVQLAFVGVLVVAVTSRATRTLLPLATLLNVSLAFPDQVPSRFRVALRGGTVRNLQAQLDEYRSVDSSDVQAKAEHLLELVAALSRHERLTRGHTERVRAYADLIAAEMGLDRSARHLLQWSCLVHDIGKLAVPPEILNKAGRPSEEEWALLRRHPEIGGELVEPLAGWLGEWRFAASQHHERWDGTGYPAGLAGTSVSLAGRIVAVADAYDVITSARSYKRPMSPEAARAELVRCSGTQFDPAVVRAFLNASVRRSPYGLGLSAWLRELMTLGQVGTAATGAGNVAIGAVVAGSMAMVGAPPQPPPEVDLAAAPVASEMAIAAAPVAAADRAVPSVRVTLDAATTTTLVATTTTTTGVVPATLASAPSVVVGAPPPTTAVAPVVEDAPPAPADAPVVEDAPPPSPAAPVVEDGSPPPPSTTPPPATTPPPTTTAPSGPQAPDVQDDAFTVSRTSSTSFEVLANDRDPDGDLRPWTLWVTSLPGQGLAIPFDGKISYTVLDADPGVVSFTYRVCDSGSRCSTATVRVTIT